MRWSKAQEQTEMEEELETSTEPKGDGRKNKKITVQMMTALLPVTIIALVLVTVISVSFSVKAINKQVQESMDNELKAVSASMTSQMMKIETATATFADSVGKGIVTCSGDADLAEYDAMMEDILADNDLMVAIGIFVGDDIMDNGNQLAEYVSVEDGEYTVMDLNDSVTCSELTWYTSVQSDGVPVYEETYVDSTFGMLMTSYIEACYDKDGNFVGAINTDVDMSAVQEIVDNVQVGTSGKAYLFSKEGQYLSGVDSEDILSTNIAEDDLGFQDVIEEMMANESGVVDATVDGVPSRIFYQQFEGYDWILALVMPKAEINEATSSQIHSSIIVSIIAIVVLGILIYLQAKRISKPIKEVQEMSLAMAAGDYSIEPIESNLKNEVGLMMDALNSMLEANRNEMASISTNSQTVSSNCNVLSSAVDELEDSFGRINGAIRTISEAMVDNSATTEELTASVHEVKEAISGLAENANKSKEMSDDIMDRAKEIGVNSQNSCDKTMNLSDQFKKRLEVSIENSKVVNSIGEMAVAISEIAEEINLLALNASIEAARAGEHGKGFAVVATEIGSLAKETADTVANIQETVGKVKDSVEVLTRDSSEMIQFITDQVTPDYQSFMDVSTQYRDDAEQIQNLSSYLADTAKQLEETMEAVALAINNIAEASQDAADQSGVVLQSVDQVSEQVENVGSISEQQQEVSRTLDGVVNNYKL